MVDDGGYYNHLYLKSINTMSGGYSHRVVGITSMQSIFMSHILWVVLKDAPQYQRQGRFVGNYWRLSQIRFL